MSDDQKRNLEQQLWNIANTLRGKMNADEFRDYILGFIFYKYLAEKMEIYANSILKQDKIKYREIKENSKQGKEYIKAIKEEALEKLGYFLKPSELFSEVAKRGNSDVEGENNFILEDLQKQNIGTLFVEGGAQLLQNFINKGLWDEARVFKTPTLINPQNGVLAPKISQQNAEKQIQLFDNQLLTFFKAT